MGLLLKNVSQYSASIYEIARSLLRSRDTQRARAQKLLQRLEEQTQANEQLRRQNSVIEMADHSNQVGQEKVLTILGVRASKLPPPGKTLRHQDVHVLAVIPGTQWKREDVAEQYKTLANKIGIPMMLLTDGAVELRESAQVLEKDGKKPILLRDMKHYAANALQRMIGNTKSFKGYMGQLGCTRSLRTTTCRGPARLALDRETRIRVWTLQSLRGPTQPRRLYKFACQLWMLVARLR